MECNINSKISGYETLETLGQGAFGLVNKVKRKKDGKILAMKIINMKNMDDNLKKLCRNESSILNDVIHENIIR